MPAPEIQNALREYKAALERCFGERLLRVVLFGSQARGVTHTDSDIDVLIVVATRLPKDGHRAVDAAVEVMLRRPDAVISPLVMTPAELTELRSRERLLVRDIDREGIDL